MDAPSVFDPLLVDAAIEACKISPEKHADLIFWSNFWSGVTTSMVFGIISYFGFLKNPNVQSNSILDAFIKLIRALMQRIFNRSK